MREIDPGHVYHLDHLDYDISDYHRVESLRFVKREGSGYPGNIGHHAGTTTQEVMRVLIARLKYVDNQIPHWSNKLCIQLLRQCILYLEMRASNRHNTTIAQYSGPIEFVKTEENGHLPWVENDTQRTS